MMQIRTKAPLFLCILMVSTTINLRIGKAGGSSITDNEEASDGNLFNTSTTILAGSSLSFENGSISGNMSIVIIAPCSSDNYQLPLLSPNSTDHNNIASKAFANSSSAHPLHEMACWRSSLNIITLHVQVGPGITNSITEEHFSTGEKVLCGAFLCWSTDHQSIDCKTSACKNALPLHQNAQTHNLFPLSAVATGRRGSSTEVHCGLAKGKFSLYCWPGNQFENGSFLAPVLLNGYYFEIVHQSATLETRNEERSSESRQLMDVATPVGRNANISSHINVDIPAVVHGAPSSPAVAPGANSTIPLFNPPALPSSRAVGPAPTVPSNAASSSPASFAPSPTVNTTGNTPRAVPFATSSPTVAPAPVPTSSEASAPAPSFLAVGPAPAISSTAPAAPASRHKSSVKQIVEGVFFAIALLVVSGVIGLGTYAVLHYNPGPGGIDTRRIRPTADQEQTAPS